MKAQTKDKVIGYSVAILFFVLVVGFILLGLETIGIIFKDAVRIIKQ